MLVLPSTECSNSVYISALPIADSVVVCLPFERSFACAFRLFVCGRASSLNVVLAWVSQLSNVLPKHWAENSSSNSVPLRGAHSVALFRLQQMFENNRGWPWKSDAVNPGKSMITSTHHPLKMYTQHSASMAPPQQKPETFMLSNEAQQSLPLEVQQALHQVDNCKSTVLI